MLFAPPRDPRKVKAGQVGAAVRWAGHESRIVRLDALTPEQRRLVLALVQTMKAAPVGEMSGAARAEVGREHPTAAA